VGRVTDAGRGFCGWAFAAAELNARACADAAGARGAADVGAGGGGADACITAESASDGASESCEGCRADGCAAAEDATVEVAADPDPSLDRAGSSASVPGAGARAIGGGATSSIGAGAVRGFGGGARRGGTIRNPATAATATIPTTVSAVRVLFAGDSGALNLGALALAPCLTACSAANCAACASNLRRSNSLGLLVSAADVSRSLSSATTGWSWLVGASLINLLVK
jgi:hypothetical protein